MIVGTDVVKEGFVASLGRPGGNITGLTWEMGDGATVKRLEHLKVLVPRVRRVCVLVDPPYGDQRSSVRQALEEAALKLNISLGWADITDDFDRGFAAALAHRPDALIWLGGGLIGLGLEKLRWPRAVRPGDELRFELEILALRESQSRPQHGLAAWVLSGTVSRMASATPFPLPLPQWGTKSRQPG